jgi:hypothetical protein
MLRIPYLTDLDSRAAVKGSRDPLGQMAIWTKFGRHVVGNLTTVSNSYRDFTVLLLGFWFLERALQEGSEETAVALFIKREQLAGYARHPDPPASRDLHEEPASPREDVSSCRSSS